MAYKKRKGSKDEKKEEETGSLIIFSSNGFIKVSGASRK